MTATTFSTMLIVLMKEAMDQQSDCPIGVQIYELEQQLHDANSQSQTLSAASRQLQKHNQTLKDQLRTAQQDCQDAQKQLHDHRAAFEEESASMHTLASRLKEERVSLESDKQTLDALVKELTRKAEVSHPDSCVMFSLKHGYSLKI